MFGYYGIGIREYTQPKYTVYVGKAQQQTEANVQKVIGENQTITQSSMDKIVARTTKKGSCTFMLSFRGEIQSIR